MELKSHNRYAYSPIFERPDYDWPDSKGQAPGGWMGPWISESVHTPNRLKEAGYRYLLDWCADDQPFWMTTRPGAIYDHIVSLPEGVVP